MRAQRGDRDRYQPISSSLCASSAPLQVAQALLELHPFATLYIADLDAIRGRGDHRSTVAALCRTFPQVEFWVDAGFADPASVAAWQALDVACVVGSESQRDAASAVHLLRHLGPERAILSLDSHSGHFLGPTALLQQSAEWPQRLIAMNLARVGSHAGPDFDLLGQLQQQNPAQKIYAAGGVRDAGDLEQLAAMGIAGALIASALHDGQITAADLLH